MGLVELRLEEDRDLGAERAARGFTEVGIDALAMVLRSKRAVAHSIEIIREGVAAFARLRSTGA